MTDTANDNTPPVALAIPADLDAAAIQAAGPGPLIPVSSPAILTIPRRSQVLQLGPATLILGDALEALAEVAEVSDVLADPPYSSGGQFRGDRVQGSNAKYLNRASAKTYDQFTGDNRDQRAYEHWSALWLNAARAATAPGGLVGVFTDWRQLPTTTDALQSGGWTWRGILVWDKTEGTRPVLGRYRNQSEFMAWGSNGARAMAGPVAPGVVRKSVDRNKAHATAKPVELMTQLLAPMGGRVLDPFMGSASTGVACLETGREFVGIEAHPDIFEGARVRIEQTLERLELARQAAA